MRVTHLIRASAGGTIDRYLLTLLPALLADGIDVDLVVLASGEAPADGSSDPAEQLCRAAGALGIPATCQAMPDRLGPVLPGGLIDLLRQRQPDVVHTHLTYADTAGVLAARRANKACAVVSSRYYVPDSPYGPLNRWFQRWLWQRIDRGLPVSEAVRQACIEREGARPDRLTTVGYGLSLEALRVGQGARAVLSAELGLAEDAKLVGILADLESPPAAATDALKAFWQVSGQQPDLRLLVIGDGPGRAVLEGRARGYGLAERTIFLGWRRDTPAILAALDVLLLARGQASLLAALEAMALGTPVIACEDAGLAGIIANGETGLVVPGRDVDQLTSSLALLLDDSDLSATLAAAGQAHVAKSFPVAQAVSGTRAVYEQVARRR